MWNLFWPKRQKTQEFQWTIIAPETRGQEETMALRENADDLGAAVALREVIEASRPRNNRVLSSHVTSRLSAKTNLSNVSADSEEYIRNPYVETGRRPRRQQSGSSSTPLPAVPPTRVEASVAVKSKGKGVESPKIIRRNLLAVPVAAGSPDRQYITSGPQPPAQRGRVQSSSQAQPPSTPQPPRRRTLTQRHRSASSPAVLRDRHGISPPKRSARSF